MCVCERVVERERYSKREIETNTERKGVEGEKASNQL